MYRVLSLIILLFIIYNGIQAEGRKMSRLCQSGAIYDLLPPGSSYHEVIKKIGSPKYKIEQETKRQDIWIYDRAAFEFKAGVLQLVRCQNLKDKSVVGIAKVVVDKDPEKEKPRKITIDTSEDAKNVGEAINALSARNSEAEKPKATTNQPAAGEVKFPTGTVPPAFGADGVMVEPYDLVE